jgi:hypothetical protein
MEYLRVHVSSATVSSLDHTLFIVLATTDLLANLRHRNNVTLLATIASKHVVAL